MYSPPKAFLCELLLTEQQFPVSKDFHCGHKSPLINLLASSLRCLFRLPFVQELYLPVETFSANHLLPVIPGDTLVVQPGFRPFLWHEVIPLRSHEPAPRNCFTRRSRTNNSSAEAALLQSLPKWVMTPGFLAYCRPLFLVGRIWLSCIFSTGNSNRSLSLFPPSCDADELTDLLVRSSHVRIRAAPKRFGCLLSMLHPQMYSSRMMGL